MERIIDVHKDISTTTDEFKGARKKMYPIRTTCYHKKKNLTMYIAILMTLHREQEKKHISSIT